MSMRTALGISICSAALLAVSAAAVIPQDSGRARPLVDDFVARLASTLCLSTATASATPTFASEMAAANERMHLAMATIPTGDPDRDFMLMMIPHHQGALDMALVQLKYGKDKTLKRLAQSIAVEQAQEIAYMRALLAKRDRRTSVDTSVDSQGAAQ